MTVQEMTQLVEKAKAEEATLTARIVDYARGLVSTLKDAGRPEAARQLEELFFLLDANQQQVAATVQKEPELFFQALMAKLEGRRP